MARKRLSLTGPFAAPPAGDPLDTSSLPPRLETKATGLGVPPIARVAGDASATAALDEMTQAWIEAQAAGRMVQSLPLKAVHETWLVRDRLSLDNEEMADLVESIRDRGQQVPIEVVALEDGRFGLISGWRRLRALRALSQEHDGARFGRVLALLRKPAGPAEAYRAMVEENEIRANLSYYERARIAARAAEAGAFEDARAAVNALFAAGSRAKRSKIGSFLVLVESLDDKLRFAEAIPERLGLGLAKALDEVPGFRDRLRDRLRKAMPESAEKELALLVRALASGAGQTPPAPAPAAKPDPVRPAAARREEILPGLWLETDDQPGTTRATLSGTRLDGELLARLVTWLQNDG